MSDRPPSAPPPVLDPGRVRGVVFDLDGTLVDSFSAIAEAVNAAREHVGEPPLPEAAVRSRVGRGLDVLLAELFPPAQLDVARRAYRERYRVAGVERTRALPGVPEALRDLAAAGFRLGVASNKDAAFSRPILERLELDRYLATIHGPDTTGAHKPDPRMIATCLGELGVPASEALYVGDMRLDVEAAARAGVAVALVACGNPEGDLHATGQRVFEDVPDLARVLHGYRGKSGANPA